MTVPDLGLAPALNAAFEDGSLQLHYQPEVDLRTGELTAMEGLLRWRHPEKGLVRAPDILALAAASGLGRQLGRWVLRTGVAEARAWRDGPEAGHPPRLWLNVTTGQLARPRFAMEVERALDVRGLPKGSIGLEFTEKTLGLADRGVPRLLARLRSLGAGLAVDDFGTWYAALSTLDALPLDAVKLDGRFLGEMLRDLEGEAVIASIVALAHKRGMVVTAEGVETVSTASRLTNLGCDRAAGQLFAAPLPPEQAREIATGRRPGPWMRGTAPRPRRRPAGASAR